MKEYNWKEDYDSEEDAKLLVDKFFDFQKYQCKVEKDKDGNFFIEKDDIDNDNRNFFVCLKKIIFKKDGNIDIEMHIGYKPKICSMTIQDTLNTDSTITKPFKWNQLSQGKLNHNNVVRLFDNNDAKDKTALKNFKQKLKDQISSKLYHEINKIIKEEDILEIEHNVNDKKTPDDNDKTQTLNNNASKAEKQKETLDDQNIRKSDNKCIDKCLGYINCFNCLSLD